MTSRNGAELLFLPLGGAGEFGMNMNLYGYGGKWLLVDLGIAFADDRLPGIDVLVPDPQFIAERKKDLTGLILTHAHEDHIGAVPYLWAELECPVYATPFTATVLRRKLEREGIANSVNLIEVPLGGRVDLPPFQVEFVSLTHSIPEPNGLAIRTPAGLVMHMTDWKIDAEPMVGGTTDVATLTRLGAEGVLALVCDSTNVFVPAEAHTEGDIRSQLTALVAEMPSRVAITTFSSNIARILSAVAAAEANGRSAVLVGRSIKNMIEAARETGYARDLPPLLSEAQARDLPPDKVLFIVSGCQGEPRAAMTRIASRTHPAVAFDPGDTVIYSSKMIPGNERAIHAVQNDLARQGVRIVTEKDHPVHASGHPSRPELARMYGWLKPRIAVPIHGDTRHLREHGAFAEAHGVPCTLVVENGTMLRFGSEGAEIVDHVPTGRMAVDGLDFLNPDGEIIRARRRLMEHGSAYVALVLDGRGRVRGQPRFTSHGVIDADDAEVRDAVVAAVAKDVKALPAFVLEDDDTIREAVVRSVRKTLKSLRDKRPMIDVEIIRV